MIKNKSWRLNKSEGDKPRRKGTPSRRNVRKESQRQHMSREQRVYPSNQNVFQIKGDTVSHRLGPWA